MAPGVTRSSRRKKAPAKRKRTSSSSSSRQPKGASRDERKKAILKAAVTVFADKGYHGCRISDVAEEAGVAYGLVYHYFGNKDALLSSIFETNWAVFLKAVDAIVEEKQPTREKLRQIIDFLINAYEATPLIVKVLILEFGRSSRVGDTLDTPEMNHFFLVLERLLQEAAEEGQLRDGIEPRAAAVLLLGAVESALTSLVVVHHGPAVLELEDIRRALHTLFTDGLLSPS
jgi:TetR/AcrR family fatty acid metabolism transcriptional regulator